MTDPRRVSDELLLELLRQRLHDSEIAVRLGITTGQLRERKTELRNRLGAERYEAAFGTAARRQLSPRTRLFLWGAAIAAGCFAILLGLANIFAGEPEEEAPIARAQPTVAVPSPLAVPSAVSEGGRMFHNAGRFLATGSSDPGAVGTVFNRLGMVAIELHATTYVTNSDFVTWSVVSASRTDAFLRGTLSDRQIDVALYSQRPGAIVRTVAAGVGPLLEIGDDPGTPLPPTVMLVVTEGGRPVEARLRDDGTLLLALAPLSGPAVVDAFTGHALDVTAAQPFGRVPVTVGTTSRNGCNGSPPAPHPRAGTVSCRVLWQRSARWFTVPFDGVYSCSGARSLRYEGGGVRLEFILVGQSTASFACQPAAVAAGQTIVPDGEWVVSATIDGTGEVSVVVGLDGQIYVGEVRGEASCPCLPRPT